jgi:ribosomal protein L40E
MRNPIMDITKFNKELANKVSMAKRAEINNEIDVAIKIWLDVSEMALKFSKTKSIDTSFRNILLKRIENIIQHIKNLKLGKVEKEIIEENLEYIEPEEIEEPPEKNIPKTTIQDRIKKSLNSEKTHNLEDESLKKQQVMEDSKFKNLPEGFREIKAPDDFKIVTPHDKNHMKKLLEKQKDVNMEIFRQESKDSKKNNETSSKSIDLKQPDNGKTLICFACGYDQNPPKAKKCRNCGINLNE